jgi:hypothetical protein
MLLALMSLEVSSGQMEEAQSENAESCERLDKTKEWTVVPLGLTEGHSFESFVYEFLYFYFKIWSTRFIGFVFNDLVTAS